MWEKLGRIKILNYKACKTKLFTQIKMDPLGLIACKVQFQFILIQGYFLLVVKTKQKYVTVSV